MVSPRGYHARGGDRNDGPTYAQRHIGSEIRDQGGAQQLKKLGGTPQTHEVAKGTEQNSFTLFPDLMDSASLFLTADSDTVYVWGFIDLHG